MNRATAIEFTVTTKTVQRIAPNDRVTASDNERAQTTPIRCRVLVPRAEHAAINGEAVQCFYQVTNALGETVWMLQTNQAPIIAGVPIHHRVMVALAFHTLLRSLYAGRPDEVVRQIERRVAANAPDGGVIIDLGDV